MRRAISSAVALGVVWWGLGEGVAHAQFFGQLGQYSPPQVRQRSTVSPFINLTNPGTNPAIDYYGVVRPQMEAQRSIGTLQQGLWNLADTNQAGLAQQASTNALGGLQTGHPATFFNYKHYYPLMPGGAGGASSSGGFTGGSSGGFTGGSPTRPFFSNTMNSFR